MGRRAAAQLPRRTGAAARRRAGRGLAVRHWAGLTAVAAPVLQALADRPPQPLGLRAFVPGFAAKLANLAEGLASGALRAIQAVATARPARPRRADAERAVAARSPRVSPAPLADELARRAVPRSADRAAQLFPLRSPGAYDAW